MVPAKTFGRLACIDIPKPVPPIIQRITKKKLAELMHISRAQVDRIVDPDKGNVTIETLQRVASLVGRQLRVELV